MTVDEAAAWWRQRHVRITERAAGYADPAWAALTPTTVESWADSIPGMVRLTQTAMVASATGASDYVAAALAAQGANPAPGIVDPAAFAQTAADGRALGSLLYMPAVNVRARTEAGMDSAQALRAGRADLQMILSTQIADIGRQAVSAAMVADRKVNGYVRMTGPKPCSRCAVLAGKFYRYNTGFDRHPSCQCVHIPAVENRAGDVRTTPKRYFDSLPKPEQDRVFTQAGAQAIRDGADMSQVVNARRGMLTAQVYGQTVVTTTEGVTTRGLAYKAGRRSYAPRLMPESIYEIAGSREEAIRLLKVHGYIL